MEFVGRIKQILPKRSGTSTRTGNEWTALPFVFEYFENDTDRYPDSVVLETFDQKVIDNLMVDMEVRCGWSHKTREYEGKVYNELRLYKIQCVRMPGQAATMQASQMASVSQATEVAPAPDEENDDMPF